ncbi:MAG: hypothetical protein Q9181_001337 [Wetmoreana brouardii]
MASRKMDSLQAEWRKLYGETLPSLALSKSSAQRTWPVHLDHCFARIILDNAVGNGEPWTSKLKSPAFKNMTAMQLQKCIALGKAIRDGKEDLVKLDAKSLEARGKKPKSTANSKRTCGIANNGEGLVGEANPPKKRQLDIKSALSPREPTNESLPPTSLPTSSPDPSRTSSEPVSIERGLHTLITTSSLSPFRQRVLLALCQVPSGHFTSYAALSAHLQSSARAVGNALRNNPFAPRVPCHRVVAADRSLGGFGGEWGKEGKFAGEKVRLLREEGVIVHVGKGKVEGEVWKGFR